MSIPLGALPRELQRLITDSIMEARPERATDIFFEDDQTVYIMRQGQQFQLRPPDSYIWKELGSGTTTEIVHRIAEKTQSEPNEHMQHQVIHFLLAAEEARLIVLFPAEKTKRRTEGDKE